MKPKYNPEKEFNKIMNSITRKFMLERCKLYKVRHRKNEDILETLCEKYLHKLNRMKPWEIPEDENGNAGWINPNRMLEDEGIKLTLARILNHPSQKTHEESFKNLLKSFIKYVEEYDLMEELMKKHKKK